MGTANLETRLTVLYEVPFWIGLFERVALYNYSYVLEA